MVISAQIGKTCFVLIVRPQPDTLSPPLLSSWCPKQKPHPGKVLRECIPLPRSPLFLEKHSPAWYIGTKDVVRGWAPQASLWDRSVPKAATIPPAWCPQTQYPWPQSRPTLWGESGG